ncbi:MAG: phytanoyl-CoA dioxygenase family protein [Betaproteobacteria bacterium]
MPSGTFSAAEIAQFGEQGYVIVRGLAAMETVQRMLTLAREQLELQAPPLEYEADLQYPGAPASRDAPGGRTVRRLLLAYARDAVFREWATSNALQQRLVALLGARVQLSQAHHNCIMTKRPSYSSVTGWHQDIRYWAFERPELVSVWLALGREHRENGCLLLLPGTHHAAIATERLDAAKFLRTDLEENRALLATKTAAELEPGDVLFFHCRLFHAAGDNRTQSTKYSLVYTYHAADNRPVPGTRSAALPDIPLAAPVPE